MRGGCGYERVCRESNFDAGDWSLCSIAELILMFNFFFFNHDPDIEVEVWLGLRTKQV